MGIHWTGDGGRDSDHEDVVTLRHVVLLLSAFFMVMCGTVGLILWVLA